MKKIQLDTPRARARAAGVVVMAGLALLALVFFRTQVLRSGPDVLVQHGNRLRALPLPAPRGEIVDRNGVVLAGSATGTALVLMPAPLDSMRARIERIAEILDRPETWRERAERLALAVARPYVVTTELRPAEIGLLAANQRALPGVLLEPWPRRTYPAGQVVRPVVGSVGFERWPAGTGEDLGGAEAGYVVGRGGLELSFDSLLAGEPGIRYVEMDDAGMLVVDPLRGSHREPRAGAMLRTTIDAALQRYVADALPTRTTAAAVVIEIATGDVLALYSTVPRAAEDAADSVPLNAAVAFVEQPGAIFHAVTAAVALETGLIDMQRPQAVPCRGGMRYGERYFRCWKPDGHGQLALAGGIREGCDVYFHQVSLRLGLLALLETGSRLHLARPTGIELREERAGRFPSTVQDLAARLARAPNPSDALDLGAGHGLNESTLIRMTHAYAAIANGGGAPGPHLTGDSAAIPWTMDLPAAKARPLLDALASVTAADGPGAAAGAAVHNGRIRGQMSRARVEPGSRRPTGWFVGTAGGVDEPDRVAVGVLIARAPSDETAAALAGRIAEYYLRSEPGVAEPAEPDTSTPSSITMSSL